MAKISDQNSYPPVPPAAADYWTITDKSDSNKTKTVTAGDFAILVAAPASASATGVAGQIAYDSSYIYVCTATNTWKRAAIATW